MNSVKLIELYRGRGFAIVDEKYFNILSKHRWTLSSIGYAMRCLGGGRYISMHANILGSKSGFVIDHKNGDSLDNRLCNLRFATKSQNAMNSIAFGHNTSGHKGVSWSRPNNRWKAYIMKNQKQMHLGYFKKKLDAVNARLVAEKKYFGEFARHE